MLPGWSNPTSECCGNWTPDGKYFVFQSNRVEGSNIWILPEKSWIGGPTPSPSQLTAGPLNFIGPVPARHGDQRQVGLGQHLQRAIQANGPDFAAGGGFPGGFAEQRIDCRQGALPGLVCFGLDGDGHTGNRPVR